MDTRSNFRSSDALSSSFTVDNRSLDGVVAFAVSGDAVLDTGGSAGLPFITGISPQTVPGLDVRQWITIQGRNFAPGLWVVLRDTTGEYRIPPERAEWVSDTEIRIFANLTSAAAEWTVQVVNPGGAFSPQLAFQVAAPSVRPVEGLDFATVAPGGSAVKSFVVRNTGTAAADWSLGGLDAPFSIESAGSGQLAPGQEVQVSIRYNPVVAGRNGGLAVFQIGGQSVTRALSGRAADAPTASGLVHGTVRGILPGGGSVPLGGARVVLQRPVPLSQIGLQNTNHEDVTDPLGAYTLSGVAAGSYFVAVDLSGTTHDRYYIDHAYTGVPVTVADGGDVERDIELDRRTEINAALPKNAPVVLVRGLDPPFVGGDDGAYWNTLRHALRIEGFGEVWDPNEYTFTVDGTKGVTRNAKPLWDYLKAKVEDYSAPTRYGEPPRKVHFICHSMGGLIVRQLLHDNASGNYGERLPLSGDVFMLATPNAGTLAANLPAVFSGRLDELTTGFVRDTFPTTVSWPQRGSRLFFATGDRTNGESWLERSSKYLKEKGPPDDRVNDGAVTVLSNRGEYFKKIEASVSSGVAVSTPMFIPTTSWEKGYSFSDAVPHPIGQQVVPLNHFQIHHDGRVIEWIADILSKPYKPVSPMTAPAPEALLSFGAMAEPEPDAPRTLVDRKTGAVAAGQSEAFSFPVDATARLVVSLSSSGAPGFALIDPEGQTIGPESAEPSVSYEENIDENGMFATFVLSSPSTGQWQIVLDAADLSEDIGYMLEIEAESDVLLTVSNPEWLGHAVETVFLAVLGRTDEGLLAVPGAAAAAEIVLPDGTALTRNFSDLGMQGDGEADDGLFGLIQEGFVQPGEHEIVARFEGTLPDSGQAFRRAWHGRLTVAAPGGFIAGESDWRSIDADDNGFVDALLVESLVSVDEPGDYTLTGRLGDAEHDVEIHAVADFHRDATGASRAILHFRPEDLPQGKVFGPFELYDLKLFRRGEEGLVFLDHREGISTVPVSLFHYFSRSIRVTGDLNFGGVSVGQNAVRDLVIHNDGRDALEVSALHLPTGFSTDFEGVVIEPEDSANVPVVFSPSSQTAYAGVLSVESDALVGEDMIPLSGEGVAPAILVTGNAVEISPGDLDPILGDHTDFGAVFALNETMVRTFTIRNIGTAPLSVAEVSVGGTHGSEFTVSVQPDDSVAPGESTEFKIVFDPSSTGIRSATVIFTNNDNGKSPFSFAIQGTGTKIPQSITFPNLGDWLANSTIQLAATGGGSGNAVAFSVTGPAQIDGYNLLSFTGAGSVTVRANQPGNANYETATEVAHTFTVTAASAMVTLGNLSQSYDGSTKSASAVTEPAGLPLSLAHDPASPVNAGSYPVTATVTDPRYSGSANGTLVITKASQTISFPSIPDKRTTDTVNLSATGGGSSNPVTFAVTNGPAAISNGMLSFSGAGEVTITARQSGNENYEPAQDVSRTFTVTKASAAVTLGNLSQTYDGTPKPATATTDPAGKTVVLTYGGSSTAPTNAGSFEVVGTIDDPIYQGSATGTLVIAKASQSILFATPGSRAANATVNLAASGGNSGNPVTFTAEGPAQVDGGNVLSFTGPGSVTVRANQAGNGNYAAAPEVSHTFNVTAVSATITLARLHQVADGSLRQVLVTANPTGLEVEVTYDGETTPPITPGSYAVAASFADARYEGSANGTLVVDDPARSVVVPGGSLPALSALGDLDVPTIRLGAYEVTGSQWATVVAWAEASAGYDFGGAGSGASGDRPATGVSWYDAAKWCNARTEWENALRGHSLAPAYRVGGTVYKTGVPTAPGDVTCDFGAGGYRLPTAAEWEYAARGGASGTPSTYPGGNTLDDLGWHASNSNGGTRPAGGKTANSLGLYDLAGNAGEWTWDSPTGAPGQRILRGGAWSSAAGACELSALTGESPAQRLDRSGFRVVNSVSLALTAALDQADLTWNSGGAQPWFAQTGTLQSGTTHDGTDAAESGPLAQGQSSWLETSVTGPGNLRFRWKSTGTESQDVLAFALDGTPSQNRSGTGDWEGRLVEIGSGTHILRWTYTRGSATGEARAWLDTVSFETAGPPSVTTAAPADLTTTGATLGGEVTDDGRRAVSARGVVYATSNAPTLGGATELPATAGGVGSFTVSAVGLSEGTTYYARAYATNNLGTSYGAQVAFTTETKATFTNGVATFTRSLVPGGRQVFHFTLSGPRVVSLSTLGGAALRADLYDGVNNLITSFTGDADFDLEEILLAGDYELYVFRQDDGGPTQSFDLTIDASVMAASRPDVAVGASAGALTGNGIYPPVSQLAGLTSLKLRPVTGYATIANRGNLPDVLTSRTTAGNTFFKVTYWDLTGNVTAGLLAGTYRTPELVSSDMAVSIKAAVTPNKKKLTKKQGTRTLIVRKTHALIITATSTFDPAIQDAASIKVQTK